MDIKQIEYFVDKLIASSYDVGLDIGSEERCAKPDAFEDIFNFKRSIMKIFQLLEDKTDTDCIDHISNFTALNNDFSSTLHEVAGAIDLINSRDYLTAITLLKGILGKHSSEYSPVSQRD